MTASMTEGARPGGVPRWCPASGPHTIARGGKERLFGAGIPRASRRARSAVPSLDSLREHGVDVAFMHGVGHFMMLEDPKRFNDLLDGAITSLTDD